MRNLKRALSLALASVMLVGMMVVGTSAASYPDVDSNDNVEAIAVLQAVGAMVGDDAGNFNPDKNVTRNEMAAVMARLLLGEDSETYVGNCVFPDVPGWAQKYVAACYDNGIVGGRDDGLYHGDDIVTGVEAAAMMLRVLGYTEMAPSANWETPIVAKAAEIRLFKGINVGSGSIMNRNQVAQLSLNALEADVVTVGHRLVASGGILDNEIIYTKVESTPAEDYRDGADQDDVQQLCEKLYDGDLTLHSTSGDDNYGRPGKVWKYNTSDPIAYRSDKPILTYTGSVKQADAYKDLKSYSLDQSSGLTPSEDGGASATVGLKNITEAGSTNDLAKYIKDNSGKGVTITVYADKTNKITAVVLINTYIGQVTRVKTEDGETTVTVSKKAGGSKSANTFETTAFAKDDYVIYTVGKDGIETMEAAEVVSGKVTAIASDYLRLDGTKYDLAKNTANKDGAPAVKDEIEVYLDAQGNVVYTAKVASADKEYLYVKGAESNFSDISIQAVFSDGTTEVVKVSGETQFTANEVVASGGTKLSDMTTIADADVSNLKGDVYAYTREGNEVKLTSAGITPAEAGAKTDASGAGTIGSAKSAASTSTDADKLRFDIEKNNSVLFTTQKYSSGWTTGDDADFVVNNDTVYVMVSDGKTHIGFRNVPSMTDVDLVYVTNKDNAKLVDLVFVTKKTDGSDDNSTYFYIKDNTKYEANDGYILWTEAYIDGEKADVMTTTDIDHNTGKIDAAGLYKATKTNDKGYFSAVTSVIDKSAITGVQADVASGNTLLLTAANIAGGPDNNSVKNWSYDADTLFVSIDKDGNVTADKSVPSGIEKKTGLEEGDSVYYVFVAERKGDSGKDATTAKTVYVVEGEAVAPAAPTVTVAAAGSNSATVGSAPTSSAKGSITGYDATVGSEKNKVKVTVTAGAGSTVEVEITGATGTGTWASGVDVTLTGVGTDLVVKVTATDSATGTTAVSTYTWTVA